MPDTDLSSRENQAETEFEQAGRGEQASLLWEFAWYVRQSRKWWMIPILLALLAAGMLLFLGSTGGAPLIYTLF